MHRLRLAVQDRVQVAGFCIFVQRRLPPQMGPGGGGAGRAAAENKKSAKIQMRGIKKISFVILLFQFLGFAAIVFGIN
jgi:hypothetical protein